MAAVTGLVAQVSVSSIFAWGDNSAGQLDVPIGTGDVVALAAGGDHSLALQADGTIVAWGDNSSGQNNVHQSAATLRLLRLVVSQFGFAVRWHCDCLGG